MEIYKEFKKTKSWNKAVDIYVEEIKKYSKKLLICGSIRREKTNPKDVDIVLIPKTDEEKTSLLSFLYNTAKVLQHGDKQIYLAIPWQKKVIDLQIWFATEKDWGAQILTRTGGKFYNIALRSSAKKRGWLLNQYGLFNEKKELIASKTEEEIVEALGHKLREPKDRF